MEPDRWMYSDVICALAEEGNLSAAIRLCEDQWEAATPPDRATCNTVRLRPKVVPVSSGVTLV